MLEESAYQQGKVYREKVQEERSILNWTKLDTAEESVLATLITDTKDDSIEKIAQFLEYKGSAGNLFSEAGSRIQLQEWDSFLKGFIKLQADVIS